jgi:uncharacterized protein
MTSVRPRSRSVALYTLIASLAGLLGLVGAPATAGATTGDLVISGVVDGPITGGLPKAVELYVVNDIADLSVYGIESANNGAAPSGAEVSLPAEGAAAGEFLYIATESPQFEAFFGFAPDVVHGGATNINGDDTIVLYESGSIVDVFGEIGVDGTGTSWEHTDGWAYRVSGTGQDGATFVDANWTYSGVDALDGATTNAGAGSPMPVGTYSTEPVDPEPEPDPEAVFIHEVQGAGDDGSMAGTEVIVQGVVVGDFQTGAPGESGDLGGFNIQEEDLDADVDPATSEGVFVFHDATDVAVGDLVTVTGTVTEYFDLTEIVSATVTVDATAQTLPSAAAPSLPTTSGDPSIDWEAIEGMRAQLGQTLTVTEQFTHGRFGEIVLSAIGAQDHPNQIGLPGSADADAVALLNQRSRIQLDDGLTAENPDPTPYLQSDGTLRDGDTVTGLTGVVGYAFGDYEILPVVEPSFARVNERPSVPAVGGDITVASFNVLNYFTTLGSRGADTPEELEDQGAKIVAALDELDADVVGLIEIENNGGVAVDDLVARLNAASDRTYDGVDTGVIGTDEITVALIYDTATVSPVGTPQILDESVSPAFLDDLNRPALAQTFEDLATGATFTPVVNHLKSKGSACTSVANPGDPAYGVEPYAGDPDVAANRAGNCNLTRLAAARVLGQWLTGLDPDGNTLILGDLNSYANEDPIRALEDLGYVDLVETETGGNTWAAGAHSYVFDGEHGALDYALAGPGLQSTVTGAGAWHINADEPPALDYNDWNPPSNVVADPYRSSDHDPLVVGLSFAEPEPQLACDGASRTESEWAAWADAQGYDLVIGTEGDDLVIGTFRRRALLVLSLGGNDLVLGTHRADLICGGDGDDLLLGAAGADVMRGDAGDDVLLGGAGRDDLDGGPGHDLVI